MWEQKLFETVERNQPLFFFFKWTGPDKVLMPVFAVNLTLFASALPPDVWNSWSQRHTLRSQVGRRAQCWLWRPYLHTSAMLSAGFWHTSLSKRPRRPSSQKEWPVTMKGHQMNSKCGNHNYAANIWHHIDACNTTHTHKHWQTHTVRPYG